MNVNFPISRQGLKQKNGNRAKQMAENAARERQLLVGSLAVQPSQECAHAGTIVLTVDPREIDDSDLERWFAAALEEIRNRRAAREN